ncbi:hypothetical protein BU23DRAFT_596717 [Bimuria novae-zelandiae CBS 107.79]|uniref:C2H2-type domain-containing protein n=1 Tax=Bimuria novae-zelandiae CBS 107.79 TaxID=1447943 RepID=A0A6A5VTZ5_9PLEO|nr:hypothetical protein BU23DRAFT_596717 [Bimuria novae-zelandiae CBS 107.79]
MSKEIMQTSLAMDWLSPKSRAKLHCVLKKDVQQLLQSTKYAPLLGCVYKRVAQRRGTETVKQPSSSQRCAIAPASTEPYIQHLSNYGHLFCTPCRTALPLKWLQTHLLSKHRIFEPRRSTIVAQYEHIPVSQNSDDIKPLPDGSPVLEFLTPPVPGFACQCSYKTINVDGFQQHLRKVHKESYTQAKRIAAECFLQKWAPPKSSFPYQYWRMDVASSATQTAQAEKCESQQKRGGEAGVGILEATGDPEIDALLAMEAEEGPA